jgi:hypothetical protein
LPVVSWFSASTGCANVISPFSFENKSIA